MQTNRRRRASGRTAVLLTSASLVVLLLAGFAILRASAFYASLALLGPLVTEVAGPPDLGGLLERAARDLEAAAATEAATFPADVLDAAERLPELLAEAARVESAAVPSALARLRSEGHELPLGDPDPAAVEAAVTRVHGPARVWTLPPAAAIPEVAAADRRRAALRSRYGLRDGEPSVAGTLLLVADGLLDGPGTLVTVVALARAPGDLAPLLEREARAWGALRRARAEAVLRRFRAERGRWPLTLDEARGVAPPASFEDPWDRRPFDYADGALSARPIPAAYRRPVAR